MTQIFGEFTLWLSYQWRAGSTSKTGRFLAQNGDSNLVKISVVISCYNKKNTIEEIVAALYAIIKYNFLSFPRQARAATLCSSERPLDGAHLRPAIKIS
jgi:hypothetical protein